MELCPNKATGVKDFSILIKYVGTGKRVMLVFKKVSIEKRLSTVPQTQSLVG
jgi:hypothetical protein